MITIVNLQRVPIIVLIDLGHNSTPYSLNYHYKQLYMKFYI